MARGRKTLTAQFVRSVTKPGKYYDGRGDGLVLRVAPGGSKQWVWRGTVQGRRRDYGLGAVRYTSLAEARRIAYEYRKIARRGGDPRYERNLQQIPTFEATAEVVIGLYGAKWKPGSRSADQWRQSLNDYVYPAIGSKRVDQITTADVMAVLTPIWATKPSTAKRVRQRISAVMAWAVAQGHRKDDPAGSAITKALPKTNGPRKNLASVPHREASAALRRIDTAGGYPPARMATQFAILTAARSGEVRGARWSEIDQQTAIWTIPAERMRQAVSTVFRSPQRLSASSPRLRSSVTRPTPRRSCSRAPRAANSDPGNYRS
ncbi:MAG: integrase arm-type DNA-binding domain-containing protein [bacterium]|nr:integrase arm-type DNA-binding domain-containing protein [bacterium]MDE0288744.1 integrase arm-type DNA-binding domain-containing protein [bacterium]MDE0437265.1 integrase arm-type DNA-binding domain-containing protein [bacterium]